LWGGRNGKKPRDSYRPKKRVYYGKRHTDLLVVGEARDSRPHEGR